MTTPQRPAAAPASAAAPALPDVFAHQLALPLDEETARAPAYLCEFCGRPVSRLDVDEYECGRGRPSHRRCRRALS